jgi:methylenetetrahydrofolate reductase (NADPH)
MKYLKRKVEAGAEFLVTQMFFDNRHYFDFVAKCRENGIQVPIIPGIKPLSTAKQMEVLPRIFHIEMPEELRKATDGVSDDAAIKQIGTEWATMQCKELMQKGAPVLHFYTMGKSEQTSAICRAIF